MRRSALIEFLLLAATVCAFIDEPIRKSIPTHPVEVTAVKDLLVLVAGLIALARLREWDLGRQVLYLLPWVLVAMLSGIWVAAQVNSAFALVAELHTYCMFPLTFAAGYYLGVCEEAQRKFLKLFAVFAVLSTAIVFLQELARDALPPFLAMNIFREQHSGAGGGYAEGLFASPQTAGLVTVCFVAFAALSLLRGSTTQLFTLAPAAVSLFFIRNRTSVVMASLAVLLVLLLGRKSGVRMGKAALRFVSAGLVLIVVGGLIVQDETSASERDRSFFMRILNAAELEGRLMAGFDEIGTDMHNHNTLTGYGIGTTSRMRQMLSDDFAPPDVRADTGPATIWAEMGLPGLIVFAIGFIAMTLRQGVSTIRMKTVAPAAVAALVVSLMILLWFWFKAKTVMVNGMSRNLWLGSMGMCAGALALSRARQLLAGPADASQDAQLAADEWPTA